jgi:hypothetical protein
MRKIFLLKKSLLSGKIKLIQKDVNYFYSVFASILKDEWIFCNLHPLGTRQINCGKSIITDFLKARCSVMTISCKLVLSVYSNKLNDILSDSREKKYNFELVIE